MSTATTQRTYLNDTGAPEGPGVRKETPVARSEHTVAEDDYVWVHEPYRHDEVGTAEGIFAMLSVLFMLGVGLAVPVFVALAFSGVLKDFV
jgi:hypothetical protein